MELMHIAQYMEVRAVLKEGVDFGTADLQPDTLTGGRLQYLASEVRRQLAADHGFDECTWSGSYNGETGTVEVVMRKQIADTFAESGIKIQTRQNQQDEKYFRQRTSERMVETVYLAILRNQKSTIPTKRRISLLDSLEESEDMATQKDLCRAHFLAMEKIKTQLRCGLI